MGNRGDSALNGEEGIRARAAYHRRPYIEEKDVPLGGRKHE